jgi:hypothetical protein
MKLLNSLLILILGLVYYLAACEKKCWEVNCADQLNFQLIDKSSQLDLVFGITPRYKLDSMQLNKLPDFSLGHHQNFLGSIHGDSHGLYTSTGDHPVDTTYLCLTFNDIDTIIINYIYEVNRCCTSFKGYGKINGIRYNGKIAAKKGEFYKFEKE